MRFLRGGRAPRDEAVRTFVPIASAMLLGLVTLAGCGGDTGTGQDAAARGPASSGPPTTTAPLLAPKDRMQRALLAKADVQPLKFREEDRGAGRELLVEECKVDLAYNVYPLEGFHVEWAVRGRPVFLRQYVVWYSTAPAVNVLDEAREALTCKRWDDGEATHRMLAGLSAPGWEGIDTHLTFCQDIGGVGSCTVILGRDFYVSRLDVLAPSPAEARKVMTAIAPKAAAALARAVEA